MRKTQIKIVCGPELTTPQQAPAVDIHKNKNPVQPKLNKSQKKS